MRRHHGKGCAGLVVLVTAVPLGAVGEKPEPAVGRLIRVFLRVRHEPAGEAKRGEGLNESRGRGVWERYKNCRGPGVSEEVSQTGFIRRRAWSDYSVWIIQVALSFKQKAAINELPEPNSPHCASQFSTDKGGFE